MKYCLQMVEVGARRPYNVTVIEYANDARELPKPTTFNDIEVDGDSLVKNTRGMLSRFISLRWSVGLVPEGGVAVEIGCDFGDGLNRLQDSKASTIIGVDPYLSADWDCWFSCPQEEMDARHASTVARFKDDDRVSIFRMTSDDYFAALPESFRADWWFIDGDHREEQCKRDVVNAINHTPVGGHVLVDDIDTPKWREEICRAINGAIKESGNVVGVLWSEASPVVLRRVK